MSLSKSPQPSVSQTRVCGKEWGWGGGGGGVAWGKDAAQGLER